MPASPEAPTNRIILVTGPARSGKSEWAESLAQQTQQPVIYLATARRNPDDPEWQARIQQHRQRRPVTWTTQEVPLKIATVIQQADANTCLLVDSLGTWVTNGLDQPDPWWEGQVATLLNSLQQTAANVILVAEEVGWGLVPAYPVGRQFRDRIGSLVRRLSPLAKPIYLVVGGHALNLSQLGVPIPTIPSNGE